MKKPITLLCSCLLLFNFSSAQEIEWQNTIGGSDEDYLYSVQQTSDGGYILGGQSTSNISGDKTENSNGAWDYWIVKADASGNIQWQNSIGGISNDFLQSIQQTSDGGYILGGYSASSISGDKTEDSNGWYDYWLVKIDALGNIQWQNTIGGNEDEELYSVQQTSDGGYILGGYSHSSISGDKTENCLGDWDYWIVKTDVSGNIQWENTIGGGARDYLYSISQTSDGGYILGGDSKSNISGDKTEDSNGSYDYWLVKIDALGDIQWQNTIGGNNTDKLYSIRQTADGGYICGGYSRSNISGDKTENSNGDYDYWIVKTDASGNIQWQNSIGGNDDEELYSIQQTSDGGYILGGNSLSNISGDKTVNCNGVWDYWIVKTDTLGNIQRQYTIGGNDGDQVYSIQQTSDGGYILGGNSVSNISGDKMENSQGSWDYWIAKLTNFNTISGKLFIDINGNQILDVGESLVKHNLVSELNTGKFSFSQNSGIYNINVLDTGDFMVTSPLNYYNSVPVNHFINFSTFQQTDSLNDFAYQPAGVYNDLCVDITPLGNFRAGFNASYIITYENVGTTTLNPTVIFFPDSDLTFVSANPVANFVATDSVVWNFGSLAPFQTGSILVTVNVNTGTPIGTLIYSTVVIEPVAGDANTYCNYAYWNIYTTGSIDPNAIFVDRDTVLTTELSNPPYLDYIIYFQNTGNDTAFNARVLNNLLQELDVTSFEFVVSSHPMNVTYGAHARLMTFTFDNILLPDSNVNEPASHGFLRYRIKPNTTLVGGDSIENTAFIYFDFNAPVQTNTAVTEIVLPTGVNELTVDNGQLLIYPNPIADELVVKSKERGEIKLFDITGKEILHQKTFEGETKINTVHLTPGFYFINYRDGNKAVNKKVVKL